MTQSPNERTPTERMAFLYGEADDELFEVGDDVDPSDADDVLKEIDELAATFFASSGELSDAGLGPPDKKSPEIFRERFSIQGRRRPSEPLCFGQMHLCDPVAPDCSACLYLSECDTTARQNRTDYRAWYDRNGIGQNDVGIIHWRHFRIPMRGVGAPPRPSDGEIGDMAKPLLGVIRTYYLRRSAAVERRRHQGDRDYRKERRANPTSMDLIERYYQRRMRLLRDALKRPKLDKFLQQFRDREGQIAQFWKQLQEAGLRLGRAPSDAETAALASTQHQELTRHQARSRRHAIAALEAPGRPWAGISSEEPLPPNES